MIEKIINGFMTEKNDEFLSTVKNFEKETHHDTIPVKKLVLWGDENTYTLDEQENTINKTAGFRINYKPCRPYAVRTMCDKLGISGSVLSKFNDKKLAKILKQCIIEFSSKDSVQVVSFENVVLSVLSENYKYLSAVEIFEKIAEEVNNLGGNFKKGYVDLDSFNAFYELKNNKIKMAYSEILPELSDAVPVLSVSTSNTGLSSVSIVPMFALKNAVFAIGRPLKVFHKGDASIDVVAENINQIYAMFKEAVDGLSRLKKIKIENPADCFKNVAKRVLLPKRYVVPALESFECCIPDENVTAYDIYLGLTDVILYAQLDNRPAGFINTLREQIARALYVDFQKYDVPYSD